MSQIPDETPDSLVPRAPDVVLGEDLATPDDLGRTSVETRADDVPGRSIDR